MLGFKSFRSAKVTLANIEYVRMIQKCQIADSNVSFSAFECFARLIV